MTNRLQSSIMAVCLAALGLFLWAESAQAIALNRCVQVVRNPVGRETLVNTCTACVAVKVERRRPGNANSTPNIRDFTVPAGTKQPLPFRGPGKTRILSESDCQALPNKTISQGR